MLECQSCLKCPSSQPNLRLLRVRMLVFCLCLFLCVCICLQREEQLKEEARVEGQDTCARAKTVCYSCALGDFGHSYILSQHEESRSGVAHQGAEFVAPGFSLSPPHTSKPLPLIYLSIYLFDFLSICRSIYLHCIAVVHY
jgi:hypothetical protein